MIQVYSIFNQSHYDRQISEIDYKPRLRLAKISEKQGYEHWLQQRGIEVKDIWLFYLYDDALEERWCSFQTYHSLGYVGWWYDYDSLRVPHKKSPSGVLQVTNGFSFREDISSDYIAEDGEFLQHHWFQDELDDSGSNRDGNPERSILIHDFASHEGLFSLEDLEIDQDDIECKTAAEVLSQAYEAVLEYRNRWGHESLFNLFEREAVAA